MDWLLTLVGITCFYLAGRKVWWAWYIGLAGQALWTVYALTTHQYGFLLGTLLYTIVYTRNAIAWTREHRTTRPKLGDPGYTITDILGVACVHEALGEGCDC